jgi:uncharacterized membrane protein YraQ (UPF0718 family)
VLIERTASKDWATLATLTSLTVVDDKVAVAFAGVAACKPVTEHMAGLPPDTVAPTAEVVATAVSEVLATMTLSVTANKVSGIRKMVPKLKLVHLMPEISRMVAVAVNVLLPSELCAIAPLVMAISDMAKTNRLRFIMLFKVNS